MTARNLQDQVKKRGLPWSAAKGFDTFTPIGSVVESCSINPTCPRVLIVRGQVFHFQNKNHGSLRLEPFAQGSFST